MRVESRTFHCRACAKDFAGEILEDAEIRLFLYVLKTLRCPECGAGWRELAFAKRANRKNPEAQK